MEHEDNELRDFWGEETAEDRERIERVVKQAINGGYNPELNAVMHLNICNAGLVRPGPSQCLQSQAGTLLYPWSLQTNSGSLLSTLPSPQ